jgi:small subunit ribosomal protein S6
MSEQRVYETTYIITPELTTDDFVNIIEKFNRVLTDNKSEIINQEKWGFRKLAYEINRKQSGYYVYTEFKGPPEIVHILEREYSYDERIMRYLTVVEDKDAIAYNQKRRTRIKEGNLTPGPTPYDALAAKRAEAAALKEAEIEVSDL